MPRTFERVSPTTARITRLFAASPARVVAAHSDPALVRQWLLGPEGCVMIRCEINMRPGGQTRYDWAAEDGSGVLSDRRHVGDRPAAPNPACRAHGSAFPDPRQYRRDAIPA